MPAADDDSDYSEFAALQSSEDAANVTCMFCDAAFAENINDEIWIKCASSHVQFVGP